MKITLTGLIIGVTIAAIVLTLISKFMTNRVKSLPMTFIQHFCGALFLFSGMVKAVDPLGTAYKMEQYFDEFASTFEGTWMSFIAPMFPWLSNYATGFSVGMIVFEIVLAVMLLIGTRPKLTAWAFLVLVAFFTILTGFTFLTGYVPNDVNFFSFGQWAEYNPNNMKVTDCGCFGDFLKLEPRTSFFKDVFLMVPSIIMVLGWKNMHQFFSEGTRLGITGASFIGLLIYCFSNFVWDIPDYDFRPFHVAANIPAERVAEEEAQASVQITHWKLKNKSDGKELTLENNEYMSNYKNYPKAEWEVVDQIKTKPAIEMTKISEFEVTDTDGNDRTEDMLAAEGYLLWVIGYKIDYTSSKEKVVVNDTTYVADTVLIEGQEEPVIVQKPSGVVQKEMIEEVYSFDEDYVTPWLEKVVPFAEAAEKAGIKTYAATKLADPAMIDDFRHRIQATFPVFMADDILLKTIIRSNPGVLLLKDGEIVEKWHESKLPSFEEVQRDYIR